MNDVPAAPYWAGMPAYTQLSWMLRSAGQALLARWPVVPGSSPLPQRAQAPATLFPLASVGIRVSRLKAADLKYGRRVELAPLPWPRLRPLPQWFPRPPVPVVGAGCWGTCLYVYAGVCVAGRVASPFSLVSSARLIAFRTYSVAGRLAGCTVGWRGKRGNVRRWRGVGRAIRRYWRCDVGLVEELGGHALDERKGGADGAEGEQVRALAGWLAGLSVAGWPAGWLAGWQARRLAGLAGLAGLGAGWLAGLVAG